MSCRPIRQPVGAIDLVLIEQIGQALGQLVALAQVLIISKEAAQRSERLLGQQARQQPHQTPGQRCLVQRRLLRNRILAQHIAVRLPEKSCRQVNVQRRSDATAVTLGQRQLEPLGDAVALHQQHLVLQWSQRVAAHPLHGQRTQLFEVVAVNNDKAGGQLRAGGHRLTPVENRSTSLPAFGDKVRHQRLCHKRPEAFETDPKRKGRSTTGLGGKDSCRRQSTMSLSRFLSRVASPIPLTSSNSSTEAKLP